MEVGEDTLYLQLHKLSGAKSEDALDQLLSAIWQSRKTGLRGHHDKSHFHSLLNLPSLSDLDPVLACLRSLVRKCANADGFAGDDVLKLFPPDLPLDLRQSLLLLLRKYHSQWKEDLSREQRLSPRPRTSLLYNVKTGLWPRQDDAIARPDQNDVGSSMPIVTENNVSQSDLHKGSLPCLKSMTWNMENSGSEQAKRVAVITLNLQDCTKSPSGEMEVKFQLTRDTLEAMLRSLTYINDQLLGTVGLEPMQKKQKQSDTSA